MYDLQTLKALNAREEADARDRRIALIRSELNKLDPAAKLDLVSEISETYYSFTEDR